MVDRMTFAEFFVSIKGYAEAHSSEKGNEAPSEDEYLRVLMEEQMAGRA
jgi:NADH:ubiquinone oxidoreductase subunit D